MTNGSLTFQKHIKRGPELPKKVQSRETDCIMSYLCQGMMKYTHNRPKKTLQNTPSREINDVKFFLAH